MIPATTPLLGFSGEISWPLGKISLMVSLGEEEHSASTLMNFMVLISPSPYNGIIGRLGLRTIQAVSSTAYEMLKFPVEGGIVTLSSNNIRPAECKMVVEALSGPSPNEPTATEGIKVAIHPEYPEQTVMVGVPRSIAEHRLNIQEGCPPIRQKRRGQAPDKNKAIQEEVTKLVKAQIMREEVLRDVEETFQTLRMINMKLNPKKCTFGAEERMFLGHIINMKGIKACSEKEEAVIKLQSPKTLKESDFQWTPEAERAFQDMKQCITELPMVTAPRPKEELIVYLCAAKEFDASNNEAEYEALITRLRISKQIGVQNLSAKVDSRLVANQISGSYIAKEESMIQYLEKAKAIISNFINFLIEQIPRSKNKKVDALSKIASTSFTNLTKQVLVEVLKEKSIKEKEILAVVEEGYSWMTPLFENIINGTLPADTKEARAIKIKARQYAVINGVLYKKSFLEPWLRCMGPLQAEYMWGIDISGPFPKAQGKVKFLIVSIDYFTKWIEAKPVATITRNQVKKFVWDNIVCRFRLPGEIISDNKKQFRDNPFTACLGEGIKARLGEDNKNWVEEVPHVLWAHRTMIKTSNGDTLFSLAYGIKVVISVETGMPSLRREKAAVREAKSKAKMEKYYNAKVSNTTFRLGDFFYRSNEVSHVKETGKLGLKWEGPYEVVEALRKGAYKLKNGRGDILLRT
ncbi:reverse transcriptase domain-containing protein [Tanacetum coccineum]